MKSVFLAGMVMLGSLLCGAASADVKEFYFQRLHPQPKSRSVAAATFTQKVNQFDPADPRTFAQRYYTDSTLASGPDAPVLFYLCGEATCTGSELGGAVREHARKFKMHMVALEHRYYGESLPLPTFSAADLKLLTTDQALADAAAFQQYAQTELKLTGKWVVVGGSYPGSLSAYYRMRYPQLVVGSLASSAPVKAKSNFEEYDLHVATVAGPECAAQMRKVVAEAEAALSNPEKLAALKEKFEATVLKNDDDFLYLIADMGALAVQYGYRDRFCKLLDSPTPLEGYASFARQIFVEWGMTAESMSAQGALSEDPKTYIDGFGMRQWFYQSCTEYGYWQNAYHDSAISVRSSRINASYHQNLCRRLFNIETEVDTSHVNETLYQPLFDSKTSNILFTNGSQDPWSNLSITAQTENPNITLFTIAGAAHCDDLRRSSFGDSEALKKARALFQTLITEWLK